MKKVRSLSAAARALGSKGGKKRAKTLTAEQRSAIAKKGAAARWKGPEEVKEAADDLLRFDPIPDDVLREWEAAPARGLDPAAITAARTAVTENKKAFVGAAHFLLRAFDRIKYAGQIDKAPKPTVDEIRHEVSVTVDNLRKSVLAIDRGEPHMRQDFPKSAAEVRRVGDRMKALLDPADRLSKALNQLTAARSESEADEAVRIVSNILKSMETGVFVKPKSREADH